MGPAAGDFRVCDASEFGPKVDADLVPSSIAVDDGECNGSTGFTGDATAGPEVNFAFSLSLSSFLALALCLASA